MLFFNLGLLADFLHWKQLLTGWCRLLSSNTLPNHPCLSIDLQSVTERKWKEKERSLSLFFIMWI